MGAIGRRPILFNTVKPPQIAAQRLAIEAQVELARSRCDRLAKLATAAIAAIRPRFQSLFNDFLQHLRHPRQLIVRPLPRCAADAIK
jgi:hypothetical protein